ncbi:MAG TPA: hypothetical protein VMW79_07845 [Anaerolineae bacterium]|nr:hypothetical protein [Anaerolineae bacterium]
MDLLEQLLERRDQLKTDEVQAIHSLGFVAGRLEELETLIKLIETPTEVSED